ncbi:unnamed protein product, partial [Amoebophrya sp. A25]|eukprot:GSA25T00020448001.1
MTAEWQSCPPMRTSCSMQLPSAQSVDKATKMVAAALGNTAASAGSEGGATTGAGGGNTMNNTTPHKKTDKNYITGISTSTSTSSLPNDPNIGGGALGGANRGADVYGSSV